MGIELRNILVIANHFMLGKRLRRAPWRGSQARNGSSLVEYALILSVITVGCVVAIEGVGAFMRSPLERLVDVNADSPPTVGAASATDASSVPHASLEDEVSRWRPVHSNLSLLACVVLACVVVAYRRRTRGRDQQAPLDRESDEVRLAFIELLAEKRQRILRILSSRTQAMFANRLEVRHVMTTDPVTVHGRTPVEELRTLMAERRVRHLLVVDPRDGTLRGLISDRDLLSRQGTHASDIMTPNPICLPIDSLLAPALTQMLNNRFSCLPLVENGRLAGVITLTDVALALQCVLQMLEHVGFLRPGDDGGHTPFEMECTLHLLQRIAAEAQEGVQTLNRLNRFQLDEPRLSPAGKPA